MALIFWIEAITSGTKDYKQRVPCIFLPKLSNLSGVFSLNVDIPNFEAIHPVALPILWKIGHTHPIYLIKKQF